MSRSRKGDFALVPTLFLLSLLSISCGGSSEAPKPKATQLVLVSAPATAMAMVPLASQPVVQATDAQGTPIPTTTTVTAEVVSGNGTVMAGGMAGTDATGRAAFAGLTLGALAGKVGALTLRFSAPDLSPVTATLELRCGVLALNLGQSVNRSITTSDCAFNSGAFYNLFEINTSQPLTPVRLTDDANFASALLMQGPNEPRYLFGWSASPSGLANRLSFKALLAQGRNSIAVTSVVSGDQTSKVITAGNYTLTIAAETEDLTCDELEAMATSPITSSQHLATGDCQADTFLADLLLIGLAPNASIAVSMTTSAFAPDVLLVDAQTATILGEGTDSGNASLTFTNGSTVRYVDLILTSQAGGSSGPYTFSVTVTNPPAAACGMSDAGCVLRDAGQPQLLTRRLSIDALKALSSRRPPTR